MSFNTPENWRGVLKVMNEYCNDKGYDIAQTDLELMAEACFEHYQGVGWKSGRQPISYWPAVARKWLIQELRKGYKPVTNLPIAQTKSIDLDASRQNRDDLRNRIRGLTNGP